MTVDSVPVHLLRTSVKNAVNKSIYQAAGYIVYPDGNPALIPEAEPDLGARVERVRIVLTQPGLKQLLVVSGIGYTGYDLRDKNGIHPDATLPAPANNRSNARE